MSCDIYEMMSHKFNFCDSIAEASIVSSRIYREQIETTIIFSSSLTLALAIWKVNWQIILNVCAFCLKMLLLKIVPEIWHLKKLYAQHSRDVHVAYLAVAHNQYAFCELNVTILKLSVGPQEYILLQSPHHPPQKIHSNRHMLWREGNLQRHLEKGARPRKFFWNLCFNSRTYKSQKHIFH